MSLSYTCEVSDDLLRMAVVGEHELETVLKLIRDIKSESRAAGRDRVLVDCRGIGGMWSEPERFRAGEYIAEVFGSKIRAAFILRPENVTKLGEIAATNRGAKILVTASDDEASEWLRSL